MKTVRLKSSFCWNRVLKFVAFEHWYGFPNWWWNLNSLWSAAKPHFSFNLNVIIAIMMWPQKPNWNHLSSDAAVLGDCRIITLPKFNINHWNILVGRLLFPFGMAYFQGRLLLNFQGVTSPNLPSVYLTPPQKKGPTKSPPLWFRIFGPNYWWKVD